ncbi:MAG: patatin-like phospholipase family protein [Thermodesulfobacteriota bacterium]
MKIELALGGGIAKGSAHLGVLKAFQEKGIKFNYVSGTSIGAFIGAVYANGNIDKLIEDSFRIKLIELPKLIRPIISKKGLFSGKQIEKLLSKFIDVENIEELSIPLSITTTEINNSHLVTFTKGSIYKAVRASISIPGILTPLIDGENMYVDGGFLEPVPVKAVRDLGAKFVVAVDLISAATKKKFTSIKPNEEDNFRGKHVFDIVQRSSIVTQSKLIENSFEKYPPDIIITPDVSEINTLDFHKSKLGIEKGIRAFNESLPDLQKFFDL